jgi:arylsulfatase A-like enzyme
MNEARVNPKGINLSYTPERIDEFVKAAKEDANKFSALVDGYKNKIQMYTIGDLVYNMNDIIQLQEKVKQAEETAKAKFEKYYNVVDKYDFLDQPDNVKELEDEMNRIDTYYDLLYYISESIDNIVDAVKRLKKII